MPRPATDAPLPSLLLVDDDETFCSVLGRALERRGFTVSIAHNTDTALRLAEEAPPEYAVVDLSMPGVSGLVLVSRLKALDEHTQVIILTGYASISTAVEAIKLGATHYLAKPAHADEIIAAFNRQAGNPDAPVSQRPLSVDRIEWEHINKVLMENAGNISATARVLGMHRRTLQRKLWKKPARE